MPLQQTSGNVTSDAYGGGVAVTPVYIEDVMSTFLYTGNGSTQTITNGIDLSGKGGLTWIKARNTVDSNRFFDTSRGVGNYIVSNSTSAQLTNSASVTAFNSNGFSLGSFTGTNDAFNYVSWTFRKQPKFFDVVTYTGNGASVQAISHSLGSTPGCILIKRTDTAENWCVFHRGTGSGNAWTAMSLNSNSAGSQGTPQSTVTSTTFDPANIWGAGSSPAAANTNGGTYVAYLFAHNAGGFGLTGTDNVISCGSLTSSGSGGATVTLNYEAQWILLKNTSAAENWIIVDTMRGMSFSSTPFLKPNLSDAEGSLGAGAIVPTATGFTVANGVLSNSNTYIYIAIRRGPMKVPTSGTSVFSPNASSAANGTTLTTNFPVDLSITQERPAGDGAYWMDRLRGANSPGVTGTSPYLRSSVTNGETSTTITSGWDNTSIKIAYFGGISCIWWNFRRAPSFFDEVCYTGTGSATTFSHNLGVAPELMIVKDRSQAGNWTVYNSSLGNTKYLRLNSTIDAITDPVWNNTTPTTTVFSVGSGQPTNGSGATYVAYLFATCAGVSKVGSYTGNGSTQTIDCGFTGGARFVLLKATSTTGNWMVYDTARGMTTLTDPFLSLNSTSAETATLGACTTVSTGFAVNESILAGVNTNGVSFVYLAIA